MSTAHEIINDDGILTCTKCGLSGEILSNLPDCCKLTIDHELWIRTASYESMLRRNRFSSSGDTIFIGDYGTYFLKVMNKRKEALKEGEAVAISKNIGWDG